MEENKTYMTEEEALKFKELFLKNLDSYKGKDPSVSDEEWLEHMLSEELKDTGASEDEIKTDAADIVNSVREFDKNVESITKATAEGKTQEEWLTDYLQSASIGMSVSEYGMMLQEIDQALYDKNAEIAEALKVAGTGDIKMSRNLDGNIAENYVAATAELSGFLQGKNIRVEVRDVYTKGSVDVRITNYDIVNESGRHPYQNFQLKFGSDAKATIKLLKEGGGYANQQIIVPTEQVQEVKEYFRSIGSDKTVSDHIEAWGVKGKAFTKEDVKALQEAAQKDNAAPQLGYSHFQTRDLAYNIAKNSAVLGLQAAAITTGMTLAKKAFNGEEISGSELVETALRTGVDASVKNIAAGALTVAVKKGFISCIPVSVNARVLGAVAAIGIENLKVITSIASGKVSVTKGLDIMGRNTTAMIGGMAAYGIGKGLGTMAGTVVGGVVGSIFPPLGIAVAVVSPLIGGIAGYSAGSKIGEVIYETGKKVAKAAYGVSKAAFNSLKRIGSAVGGLLSRVFNPIAAHFA